ncbi:MAG TPA: DUF983 domain-containing protein [Cytophagales bacterium]|nr:DUF983 domain-containing protein [Cytophagales bacterium]
MQERCPNCHQGQVFKTKGNPLRFQIPVMHEQCPVCNYRFETEPGFFTGAMYVSYGLALLEMILVYLIVLPFSLSVDWIMVAVCLPVLVFWTFNFRKSRMIWMYLF